MQHPQQRRGPVRDIRKMSNREVESLLGQQYAQLLRDSKEVPSIYKDCEQVIQGSLDLLDSYNRLALMMKTGQSQLKQALGGSRGTPPVRPAPQASPTP